VGGSRSQHRTHVDPADLARKVEGRRKAIMVVHWGAIRVSSGRSEKSRAPEAFR